MTVKDQYECPLCGTDFSGADCHSACPMSGGCRMVRCPHCAYEFVESGRFTDMLRRWIRRAPAMRPDGPMRVTEMPVGSSATITAIDQSSAARVNRLASYGIVPGSEVSLVSRYPAVVIACGSAEVAVEDEIGEHIFVAAAAGTR
jgi:Fe2+ transport system protein FeoA